MHTTDAVVNMLSTITDAYLASDGGRSVVFNTLGRLCAILITLVLPGVADNKAGDRSYLNQKSY